MVTGFSDSRLHVSGCASPNSTFKTAAMSMPVDLGFLAPFSRGGEVRYANLQRFLVSEYLAFRDGRVHCRNRLARGPALYPQPGATLMTGNVYCQTRSR